MVGQVEADETVEAPEDTKSFSYAEVLDTRFKLVNATDFYEFDSDYDVWIDKRSDEEFLREKVEEGTDLKVSGIVLPKPGATATALNPGIYYSPELTEHLIDEASQTDIVSQQLDDPDTDVFTGRSFAAEQDEEEELDLSSFITVDEDAIADAFSVDESKLNVDFSGFQLGIPEINFDPSLLPPLDLSGIEDALDVELDEDEVVAATSEFFESYLQFAEENDLDFTDVENNLPRFLETSAGQDRIEDLEQLTDSAQESVEVQLQQVFSDYVQQALAVYSQEVSRQVTGALERQIATAAESAMDQLMRQLPDAMNVDEDALLDAFESEVDMDELSDLLMTLALDENTLSSNLRQLGYADLDDPDMIDIYPKSFEAKNEIIGVLDDYNDEMNKRGAEEKVITYTDFVGTLMSSVTDILNIITYVLIAFVSISLVVSSIMIGVITYVSVLERIKEIGILRAIGASKRDVRLVFNAETLIVGFIAGALGIATTFLLTLPANAVVSSRFDIEKVAQLPAVAAVILVAISMGLTLLAGLIPAASAARKDPVTALRSE